MNSYLSIILTILSLVIVGRLILKKYNPVLVFSVGGIVLLLLVSVLTGASVMGDASTGSKILDVFAYIGKATKDQLKGVGANLMIVAAYAAYMNHIKASDKLASVLTKPLMKIGSPYLILGSVYVVGAILKLMITSHVGLSLLLMSTTFPILLSLGVSKVSAASAVLLSGALDWGTNDGAVIFAADTVTKVPVAEYFTKYQLLPAVATIIVTALIIMIYFKYLDKKSSSIEETSKYVHTENKEVKELSVIYSVLPTIPLLLVVVFSMFTDYKMDVFTANVLGIIIALIVEGIRLKDIKKISDQLAMVFKAMGNAFANILSLIIMAGVFAQGLIKLGGVNILFDALSNLGGAEFLTILALSILSFFGVIILGTGNATWFAFGPLVPDIATKVGLNAIDISVPVQLSASIGRGLSPVTGSIIAVAGVAEIEIQELIKRNVVPIVVGELVMIIVSYLTLVVFV